MYIRYEKNWQLLNIMIRFIWDNDIIVNNLIYIHSYLESEYGI